VKFKIISTLVLLVALVISWQSPQNPVLGIFEGNSDIGSVKYKGKVVFNATDSTYTISGSGTNMWFNTDELHFAYKMMSGDVSLEATIEMLGAGVDPHRKACLMIRQSLDPDAPYVDIAVHGDGLTSMQYRETKGGLTHEVKSNRMAPKKAKLQKKGKYISMQLGSGNGDLSLAGGALRMNLEEPYYIGLGVCSHNSDVVETIKFTKVSINKIEEKSNQSMKVESTLEILDIAIG